MKIGVLLSIVPILLWSCSTLDRGRSTNPHEKRLLGKRPISLQWISWDDFGEATVKRSESGLTIKGEQRGSGDGSSDYLQIDGLITNVTASAFGFDGVIETRVSHNNGGEPYRREGTYTFRLYGNRGFWRLVEMDNPDGIVDYVDIFFDMQAAKAKPSY